jgi:hypothetical protein
MYLDVDGVINPKETTLFSSLKLATAYSDLRKKSFLIKWSPELIAELNSLPCDIIMLSTWKDQSVTSIAPLMTLEAEGFLDWQVWDYDELQFMKFVSLLEDQIVNPRPFIWIDDEATGAYTHATPEELANFPSHMVIQPEGTLGLTPTHLEQIKKFLADLQEAGDLND